MHEDPVLDLMPRSVIPFKTQLLKWIGNKQRFAHLIAGEFPDLGVSGTYFEPFLGSGAVLGTLAPARAYASDVFAPLAEIWQMLHKDPEQLVGWYAERWVRFTQAGERESRVAVYEDIKASYNSDPNPADLLFLSRSCYGGVVRFRKADGYMSTPCGAHNPIHPTSFRNRAEIWFDRTKGADFACLDFREAMALAGHGDVVYCDPPYSNTQAILYGAQEFSLTALFAEVAAAKNRGAFVALSIDGTKRSGSHVVELSVPPGLFDDEVMVDTGRSMLRRFQMAGQTLESEGVADRLLIARPT